MKWRELSINMGRVVLDYGESRLRPSCNWGELSLVRVVLIPAAIPYFSCLHPSLKGDIFLKKKLFLYKKILSFKRVGSFINGFCNPDKQTRSHNDVSL